jgi:DedD protein
MARAISEEELQLRKRARRRLIGAIVLVTAVAVVLPMVLDTEPKPVSQNVNIQIPPTDAGAFTGKVPAAVPAPETNPPAKAPPATAAVPAPAVQAPPPEAPSVARRPEAAEPKPEPKPPVAPVPEAVKPVEKAPAKETAKPAAGGQFVVQVTALSDAAKARELQKKIAAAGVKAYTEVVKTAKGDVTRVRAGPYPSREAAERARDRLKKLSLDGKVVPK